MMRRESEPKVWDVKSEKYVREGAGDKVVAEMPRFF
jgi:hypothetical protein